MQRSVYTPSDGVCANERAIGVGKSGAGAKGFRRNGMNHLPFLGHMYFCCCCIDRLENRVWLLSALSIEMNCSNFCACVCHTATIAVFGSMFYFKAFYACFVITTRRTTKKKKLGNKKENKNTNQSRRKKWARTQTINVENTGKLIDWNVCFIFAINTHSSHRLPIAYTQRLCANISHTHRSTSHAHRWIDINRTGKRIPRHRLEIRLNAPFKTINRRFCALKRHYDRIADLSITFARSIQQRKHITQSDQRWKSARRGWCASTECALSKLCVRGESNKNVNVSSIWNR